MDLPVVPASDEVSEDEIEDQPTVEFIAESEEESGAADQRSQRQLLWQDPADDNVSVSLKSDRRLRKLARGQGAEDSVNGPELQKKLREQCVSKTIYL